MQLMYILGIATLGAAAPVDVEVTLRGSPASMERQYQVATTEEYPFAGTVEDVERLVAEGHLVPVPGGTDYELVRVSHPFARPEVLTFVEYVAGRYHAGCGEPLVVTSLTRSQSQQPSNAHDLSVHPAGMAVDFRVSRMPSCRKWLEEILLALEHQGVLDATRERNPPHYHVAVFPNEFRRYAIERGIVDTTRVVQQTSGTSGSADGTALSDEEGESTGWLDAVLMLLFTITLVLLAYGMIRRHTTRRMSER